MSVWRGSVAVFLVASFVFRLTRLVAAVHKAKGQGRGRTTAKPIFWIMTFCYLLFFGFGGWEAFSHARPYSWGIAFFGMALYLSALVLRERAMADLGRFFSPDIEIRSGHRVVRQGLYAWVRHPLLVCLIAEVIGLGLLLNAFGTLLVLGVGFYWPVILIRKHLEERTLLNQLGEEYRLYQQEVGALVPKWRLLSEIHRSFTHA